MRKVVFVQIKRIRHVGQREPVAVMRLHIIEDLLRPRDLRQRHPLRVIPQDVVFIIEPLEIVHHVNVALQDLVGKFAFLYCGQ